MKPNLLNSSTGGNGRGGEGSRFGLWVRLLGLGSCSDPKLKGLSSRVKPRLCLSCTSPQVNLSKSLNQDSTYAYGAVPCPPKHPALRSSEWWLLAAQCLAPHHHSLLPQLMQGPLCCAPHPPQQNVVLSETCSRAINDLCKTRICLLGCGLKVNRNLTCPAGINDTW